MQPKVSEAGATVIREVVGLVPHACSAQLLPHTGHSVSALARSRTKGLRLMKTDPPYSLLLKDKEHRLAKLELLSRQDY